MKRKAASILVTGLIVASLAGCGTKTEATEQKPENNASVVEAETETEVETETNAEDVSDETMSTEVIGEDTEETGFTGAEDDNIVLYAEIEEYGKYMPLTEQPFEADENTFTAYEDIPIYNVNGVEVGYIKNGSTITTTESGTEIYWARFENPIAGTDYDYLYLTRDYIVDSQNVTTIPSAEDIRELILEEMNTREKGEEPTILDTPDSDMEVYECRISRESDSLALDYEIRQALYNDTFFIGNYMTYSLECVEDGDFIACTIYYKDPFDEWVKNNH